MDYYCQEQLLYPQLGCFPTTSDSNPIFSCNTWESNPPTLLRIFYNYKVNGHRLWKQYSNLGPLSWLAERPPLNHHYLRRLKWFSVFWMERLFAYFPLFLSFSCGEDNWIKKSLNMCERRKKRSITANVASTAATSTALNKADVMNLRCKLLSNSWR